MKQTENQNQRESNEHVSVCMVSTPNSPTCGVGTYTGELREALKGDVGFEHVPLDIGNTNPIHFITRALQAGRTDADIIHVQHEYGLFGPKSIMSWLFFPILYVFSVLRKTPIVITLHEAWSADTIESGPRFLKWWYILAMNELIRAVADEQIFLSDAVKAAYSETGSVEQARKIPHGVTFQRHTEVSKDEAKCSFGYESADKLVVEPGFVSPQKGQDVLVQLAGRLEDVEFLIAGGTRTGRDESFLADIAKRSPANVHVTGILDDDAFHRSFRAADAIVLPYRKSGQSGVFNLCVTYEVPVAGSRCEYFMDLNEAYDCVALFELDDVSEMERTVREVINDEALREQIISGQRRMREHEGLGKAARSHVELYREVLETNGDR